jgi:hypothetical protein
MREWEGEYFRFIEEDIEPTNDPAELTIRQSILDPGSDAEESGESRE